MDFAQGNDAVMMTLLAVAMNSATLPPMPQHCDTPKTMNTWYIAVAKQNLAIGHNPQDCKAQLLSLGATPGVAGKECAK